MDAAELFISTLDLCEQCRYVYGFMRGSIRGRMEPQPRPSLSLESD